MDSEACFLILVFKIWMNVRLSFQNRQSDYNFQKIYTGVTT